MSNTLGINITEICKENPYETGEVLPELPSEVHGLLTEINKSGYVKNRMDKLLAIYQYEDFPIIDDLLSKFYVMSDDGLPPGIFVKKKTLRENPESLNFTLFSINYSMIHDY